MSIFISVISFFLIISIVLLLNSKEKVKSPLGRLKEMDIYLEDNYDRQIEVGPIKKISRLVPKYEKSFSKLEKNIVYSDTKYSLEEIIAVKVMSSGAVSLFVFALSRNFLISFITFVVIWIFPDVYIDIKAKKRMVEFNSQISDGMMVISNALKAGYSFMQAMALVSKEMEGPLAKEFGILLKEMSFGITMEESFHNINQRVDSEDLKLVINAILIQKDVGGNLAEILDKIIETVRERQRIKAEVKTLTAQGRLSGVIITMLPFALALFLFIVNKEYLMELFKSNLGVGMVAYGIVSQIVGYIVIRKITQIEL